MNTSYTIQMASKLSGVGVHTIRAWEKRYKALEPTRDSSGHRVYTKADVEKLMLLSELCLLGYTISKVANLNAEELKALLIDLGKSKDSIDNHDFNLAAPKVEVDSAQSMGILFFALRSTKLDVINQELSKLKSVPNARDFALNVLQPLILEIAKLQSSGQYSSAESEAVFELLRFHAGHALYQSKDKRERSMVNVAVMGLFADKFEFNPILSGLLCNHYGFNYSYLGNDLSIEALTVTLQSLETHILVLSASEKFKNSRELQTYIEKLNAKLNRPIEIVVNSTLDLDIKRLTRVRDLASLDNFLSQK